MVCAPNDAEALRSQVKSWSVAAKFLSNFVLKHFTHEKLMEGIAQLPQEIEEM